MRLILPALSASLMASIPASAAVIIDFNNVTTDENVLFASSTAVPSPTLVAATNQSNTSVTFANALGLIADASGQSSTTNASGDLFGTTSVTIADGFTFSAASFNIPGIPGNAPPDEATNVFVEALGLGGAVLGSSILNIGGNGENRIRVFGDAGEAFTGFRFTLNPALTGVDALTQVRLGTISAVQGPIPEPATWMMMVFGLGFVGYSLRGRRANVQFI